jgi:uncharacterized membrane protein
MANSTPNPTKKLQNIIGAVAIILLIVFYIVEFLGYISFLVWLILALVVFVAANFALRYVRKRHTQL